MAPQREAVVDGRTARRDRNREAVLDAVLALFREDNLRPRPEDVAARSGVSLRSVYRYYSEPPALLRAAMARHLDRALPLLAVERLGEGSLEERIERFVDARLRLYEGIAPTARAARIAQVDNELIREQYEAMRKRLRDQGARHFRPELAALPVAQRRAISASIDALTQLDALDGFRRSRGFSVAETADVLRRALGALLR